MQLLLECRTNEDVLDRKDITDLTTIQYEKKLTETVNIILLLLETNFNSLKQIGDS